MAKSCRNLFGCRNQRQRVWAYNERCGHLTTSLYYISADNIGQSSGGLLYYNGDSDAASLNPALNAAMLLHRFAPLASTNEKKAAYQVSLGRRHWKAHL